MGPIVTSFDSTAVSVAHDTDLFDAESCRSICEDRDGIDVCGLKLAKARLSAVVWYVRGGCIMYEVIQYAHAHKSYQVV